MQIKQIDKVVEETEGRARILVGWQIKFVAVIAFLWSLFQLWYASPFPYMIGFGVLINVPARAIHLGFGLFLVFLTFPFLKKNRLFQFGITDVLLSILGVIATFYLFFNYEGLVDKNGFLLSEFFLEKTLLFTYLV